MQVIPNDIYSQDQQFTAETDGYDLKKLVDCFHISYTSADRSLREQAEKYIADCTSQPNFVSWMFALLSTRLFQDNQVNTLLKQSMCIYLSRHIQAIFGRPIPAGGASFREDLFKVYQKGFRDLIASRCLPDHCIIILAEAQGVILNHALILPLTKKLIVYLAKQLGNSKPESSGLIVSLYQTLALMSKAQGQQIITDLYRDLFPDLIRISTRVIQLWSSRPEEVAFEQLMYLAMKTVTRFLHLCSSMAYESIISSMLRFDPLGTFLQEIFKNFQKSQMQQVSLEVLNIVIAADQKFKPSHNKMKQKYYQICTKHFAQIAGGLCNLIERKGSESSKKMLSQGLLLTTLYLNSGPYARPDLVMQYRNTLLFDVILPSLLPMHIQAGIVAQNPTQYLNTREDLCFLQNSDTLECRAVKCLETICDKVDGSLTLIAHLCLYVLESAVGSSYLQPDPVYLNSQFCKQPKQAQIDIAFLVLSILSYTISKRLDLLKELDRHFSTNLAYYLEGLANSLQNVYFCFTYSCYSDVMFQDRKNIVVEIIRKCVLNARNQHCPSVVRIQAYDTLSNMIACEKLTYVVEPLAISIFSQVIINFQTIEATLALDFIQRILTYYQQSLLKEAELMNECIKTVGIRLCRVNEDQLQAKCLEWFSRVLHDDKYEVYWAQVLRVIDNLIQSLNGSRLKEYNYLDQLVGLDNRYMLNTTKVPHSVGRLIECVDWKADHGNIRSLFKTCNLVIVHSKEPQLLKPMFEILVAGVDSVLTQTGPTDPLQALILVHMFMQNHFPMLPAEALLALFQKTWRMASSEYMRNKEKLYGSLLLVYVIALSANIQFTSKVLQSIGIWEQVLRLIHEDVKLYDTVYDAEVFVVHELQILRNPILNGIYIDRALSMVINLLYRLYEARSLEKEYDSDTESSEDKEAEKEQTLRKLAKKQILVKHIIWPKRKDMDEFALFRKFVEDAKQAPVAIQRLKIVVNELRPQVARFFSKTLLNLETVSIEGDKTETRRILRVNKNNI